MRLALKLDVDTYRGTREGVPRLIRILEARRAGATFLFSLGPDHTGWAVRLARVGFLPACLSAQTNVQPTPRP